MKPCEVSRGKRFLTPFFFAILVLTGNLWAIARAYWLPPDGFTGGRAAVRLPCGGRIAVEGGFVREVSASGVLVRSTAPETNIRWRPPADGDFALRVQNVNPAALDIDGGQGAELHVAAEGPNLVSIAFAGTAADARAEHSLQLRLRAGSASPRFFVHGAARNGVETLERLIARANAESPDFIVSVGDHYYRAYPGNLQQMDDILASSSVPVYLTTGDDDRKSPKEEDYTPPPGESNYTPRGQFIARWGSPLNAFAWGGFQLILYENSESSVMREKSVWLARALRSAPDGASILLFAHIPPFDPRDERYKNVTDGDLADHRRLSAAIEEFDIAAGFFSHYPGYYEYEERGAPCYVLAEFGAPHMRKAVRFHFLDVSAEGGAIQIERRTIGRDVE